MNSFALFSSDENILERIREGDEKVLVTLYNANKRMIISFITKHNGTLEDAEDMLQEVLVIFWQKVRSGKYEHAAKISTFLYATVRNLWFRKLSQTKKIISINDEVETLPSEEHSIISILIEKETIDAVQIALQKLGEPCKTILLLFYWEESSMEEIAQRTGFANAETVKSKKYQCKKMLEKLLEKVDV